ncbi:T3SS effector HopA1 family protein [Sphaerisporangium fuscum]|uniref:T3SS effector HopA1 family protein n=1 Tax=Sphaerisporangium fuscum TaxID=2835868 RepID=UPI001BDDA3E6|nr:T3SS effector HopA1 family protein [Sphaerisporangium fuscum]
MGLDLGFVPDVVKPLAPFLAGGAFPEGEPGEIWAEADTQDRLADWLSQIKAEDIEDVFRMLDDQLWEGEAKDTFQKVFAQLADDGKGTGSARLSGRALLDRLETAIRGEAARLREHGTQMEHTQWMIYASLALLGLTILRLMVWIYFNGPAVLAAIQARTVLTKMSIDALKKLVLMNTMKFAVISGGLDLGVQTAQLLFGHRENYDALSLLLSTVSGGIGGAVFSVAGFGVSRLATQEVRYIGSTAELAVRDKLAAFGQSLYGQALLGGVSATAGAVPGLAISGDLDPEHLLTALISGVVGGIDVPAHSRPSHQPAAPDMGAGTRGHTTESASAPGGPHPGPRTSTGAHTSPSARPHPDGADAPGARTHDYAVDDGSALARPHPDADTGASGGERFVPGAEARSRAGDFQAGSDQSHTTLAGHRNTAVMSEHAGPQARSPEPASGGGTAAAHTPGPVRLDGAAVVHPGTAQRPSIDALVNRSVPEPGGTSHAAAPGAGAPARPHVASAIGGDAATGAAAPGHSSPPPRPAAEPAPQTTAQAPPRTVQHDSGPRLAQTADAPVPAAHQAQSAAAPKAGEPGQTSPVADPRPRNFAEAAATVHRWTPGADHGSPGDPRYHNGPGADGYQAQPPRPARGEVRPARATLTVHGNSAEVRVEPGGSVWIGRNLGSAIDLASFPDVSRTHATIGAHEDGGMWIRDEGSTFGTRVNGRELTPGEEVPLLDGDILQLGDSFITPVTIAPRHETPASPHHLDTPAAEPRPEPAQAGPRAEGPAAGAAHPDAYHHADPGAPEASPHHAGDSREDVQRMLDVVARSLQGAERQEVVDLVVRHPDLVAEPSTLADVRRTLDRLGRDVTFDQAEAMRRLSHERRELNAPRLVDGKDFVKYLEDSIRDAWDSTHDLPGFDRAMRDMFGKHSLHVMWDATKRAVGLPDHPVEVTPAARAAEHAPHQPAPARSDAHTPAAPRHSGDTPAATPHHHSGDAPVPPHHHSGEAGPVSHHFGDAPPDVRYLVDLMPEHEQAALHDLIDRHPDLIETPRKFIEVDRMLQDMGLDPSFEEVETLRLLSHHENGSRPPALSRESLEAFLNDIWDQRDDIRDRIHRIYGMYALSAEPTTRTISPESWVNIIRSAVLGRPDGAHTIVQKTEQNLGRLFRRDEVQVDALAFHFSVFFRAGADSSTVTQRVYINAHPDELPLLMRDLVREVLDDPARFPGVGQAKMSGFDVAGSRMDNIVIYADDAVAVGRVLDWLAEYRMANPDAFQRDVLPMIQQVMQGVGIGADPVGSGRSFGEVRAELIGRAFEITDLLGGDRAQFIRTVLEYFEQNGIDPERPHENLPGATFDPE